MVNEDGNDENENCTQERERRVRDLRPEVSVRTEKARRDPEVPAASGLFGGVHDRRSAIGTSRTLLSISPLHGNE